MSLLGLLATTFWVLLPAYLPNNIAVLEGGNEPIDEEKKWHQKRILGDGKTWRGTSVGIAGGILAGMFLNALRPELTAFYSFPEFTFKAIFSLATGAMLGDMAASFIKRRLGKSRGAAVPGLDQLDFLVGSLVLTYIMAPNWMRSNFTPDMIAVALIITPLLHVSANRIGYELGYKNEPW
ncbi:MAG: CDP-2,3-bis-(O-geranylgeranyl)-sn-glycerol synthase [Candidatus Nanohalobium sp.]